MFTLPWSIKLKGVSFPCFLVAYMSSQKLVIVQGLGGPSVSSDYVHNLTAVHVRDLGWKLDMMHGVKKSDLLA